MQFQAGVGDRPMVLTCSCEKGLDRLVQRQDPTESVLLDEWDDGFVKEALDDAQLESNP